MNAWRTWFTTWPQWREWRPKIPSMLGFWLSCNPKLTLSRNLSMLPWDLFQSQTFPTRFLQLQTAWVKALTILFSHKRLGTVTSPGTVPPETPPFLTFPIPLCPSLVQDSSATLSCHRYKGWIATTSTWLAIPTPIHLACLQANIHLCCSLHLGCPVCFPKRAPVSFMAELEYWMVSSDVLFLKAKNILSPLVIWREYITLHHNGPPITVNRYVTTGGERIKMHSWGKKVCMPEMSLFILLLSSFSKYLFQSYIVCFPNKHE